MEELRTLVSFREPFNLILALSLQKKRDFEPSLHLRGLFWLSLLCRKERHPCSEIDFWTSDQSRAGSIDLIMDVSKHISIPFVKALFQSL